MTLDEAMSLGFKVYSLAHHPSHWWAILHRDSQFYSGGGDTYHAALSAASTSTPSDFTSRQFKLLNPDAQSVLDAILAPNLRPVGPIISRRL